MKKSLILCSFILTTMWIQAQGKWQIIVNKKTLISTSEINDSLNTRIIKSSVWKSGGYLEVNYTEASPSNWIKSLHFIDEVNNELIKRENTTHTKIKISTLRKSIGCPSLCNAIKPDDKSLPSILISGL